MADEKKSDKKDKVDESDVTLRQPGAANSVARSELDTDAAKEAAENEGKKNEILTEFNETVRNALIKRKEAELALPDAPLAEKAWNEVRGGNPLYDDVNPDFKAKLDLAANSIETTGNSSGIAGLEEFEAKVKELSDAKKTDAEKKAKKDAKSKTVDQEIAAKTPVVVGAAAGVSGKSDIAPAGPVKVNDSLAGKGAKKGK